MHLAIWRKKKFTFENANFFTFYSNGPKNYVAWVFFFYKYGKFWSISPEQKVELKSLFSEEWRLSIEKITNVIALVTLAKEVPLSITFSSVNPSGISFLWLANCIIWDNCQVIFFSNGIWGWTSTLRLNRCTRLLAVFYLIKK